MEPGKYNDPQQFQCYRCERVIPFGEVCFSINVHAEETRSDGTISVLGADCECLVCRDCASSVEIHTIERPFARLASQFGEVGKS